MNRLLLLCALALTGCGSPPRSAPPPLVVKVPVPQPCAGVRPEAVPSLKSRTPGWSAMDARQKAAATGQWALELQGYGQKLNAATAACP